MKPKDDKSSSINMYSYLSNNSVCVLYLNRAISSETTQEHGDILFKFPSSISSGNLIMQLRGALVSLTSLMQDTNRTNVTAASDSGYKQENFSTVEKTANFYHTEIFDISNCILSSGLLTDIHSNLFILVLPNGLLSQQGITLKSLTSSLVDMICFLYGDLITAIDSPTFPNFLLKFFLGYGKWKYFVLPPTYHLLTLDCQVRLENTLLPIEAGCGLMNGREENGRYRCRSAQLVGCAIIQSNKYLVNHLHQAFVRKTYQLSLLIRDNDKTNGDDNQLFIQWYPVYPNSCESLKDIDIGKDCKSDVGLQSRTMKHFALLLLEEKCTCLVLVLRSNIFITSPPCEYVNAGRNCLSDIITLPNRMQLEPEISLTLPDNFIVPYNIKEETGKYFQWFKSQISPKSARKNSCNISEPTVVNNSSDNQMPNRVLTDGGNFLFNFLYIDNSSVGICILPTSFSNESSSLLCHVNQLFLKSIEKLQWINCWNLNNEVTEQTVGFTVYIDSFKSRTESKRSGKDQITFIVSRRNEKYNKELFLCYHYGCPQNVKTILERLSKQAFIRASRLEI